YAEYEARAMRELFVRAEAMQRLLDAREAASPPSILGHALTSCCVDLLNAGEPSLAIDLIESGRSRRAEMPGELAFRLDVLYARALQVARKNEESLESVQVLLASEAAG